MNKKFLIFYHLEDNDGVLSCAIIKHYIELVLNEHDITLVPSTYASVTEFFNREDINEYLSQFTNVIMTDISHDKWEIMKMLYDMFGSNFTWVDHHAPIINESYRHNFCNANGIRDIYHSALYNMWNYLYNEFNTKEIPQIIRILSAWDSWSFEREHIDFEECQKVNLAFTKMSKLDINWYIKNIDDIYNDSYTLLTQAEDLGDTILTELKQTNEKMMNTALEFNWLVDSYRSAGFIIMYGGASSVMFESVKDKIQNGIVARRNNKGIWTISLYNTNDNDPFNCGEYLRNKYKGGGHKGAAGCQLTDTQFIKMLKNKAL